MVVRHLGNLRSGHSRSSTHLTPYVVITILLTAFLRLYFISPWLFITGNMYFLLPSLFYPFPKPPPIWQPSKCSLYLLVCFLLFFLFCLFVFKVPYISEIIWHLSFSVFSLSIITSRSIHVVTNGKISFVFMVE